MPMSFSFWLDRLKHQAKILVKLTKSWKTKRTPLTLANAQGAIAYMWGFNDWHEAVQVSKKNPQTDTRAIEASRPLPDVLGRDTLGFFSNCMDNLSEAVGEIGCDYIVTTDTIYRLFGFDNDEAVAARTDIWLASAATGDRIKPLGSDAPAKDRFVQAIQLFHVPGGHRAHTDGLRALAEDGYPPAMYEYGLCLNEDELAYPALMEWVTKAAAGGYGPALEMIAMSYWNRLYDSDGDNHIIKSAKEREETKKLYIDYLDRAVDVGYRPCIAFRMEVLYDDGDYSRAIQLMEKGAKLEDLYCANRLMMERIVGLRCARDISGAVECAQIIANSQFDGWDTTNEDSRQYIDADRWFIYPGSRVVDVEQMFAAFCTNVVPTIIIIEFARALFEAGFSVNVFEVKQAALIMGHEVDDDDYYESGFNETFSDDMVDPEIQKDTTIRDEARTLLAMKNSFKWGIGRYHGGTRHVVVMKPDGYTQATPVEVSDGLVVDEIVDLFRYNPPFTIRDLSRLVWLKRHVDETTALNYLAAWSAGKPDREALDNTEGFEIKDAHHNKPPVTYPVFVKLRIADVWRSGLAIGSNGDEIFIVLPDKVAYTDKYDRKMETDTFTEISCPQGR